MCQTTSLLDLPPEIWSKIGKLVIDDCKLLISRDFLTCFYDACRRTMPPPQQPAVTRAIVALRGKLLPYYYTTKVAIYAQLHDKAIASWLRSLDPDHRRSISGFEILLPSRPDDMGRYRKQETMLKTVKDEWAVQCEFELIEEYSESCAYKLKFL